MYPPPHTTTHPPTPPPLPSPPELLKVEDLETHVCAIFLRICAKFVLLNAKQEKQALFSEFGTI